MYKYKAVVERVVDGDTIDVILDLGLSVLTRQRLRLYGINAPEIRGREKKQGLKSKKWLEDMILGKTVEILTFKRPKGDSKKGKYGRYIAIIYLDLIDVNRKMIQLGFAEFKEY